MAEAHHLEKLDHLWPTVTDASLSSSICPVCGALQATSSTHKHPPAPAIDAYYIVWQHRLAAWSTEFTAGGVRFKALFHSGRSDTPALQMRHFFLNMFC